MRQQKRAPRRVRVADGQELALSVGEDAAIEEVKREAEDILNERLTEQRASRQPFSVQSPATDDPGFRDRGFVWWTGGSLDTYIPISEYGAPQRMEEIRAFALVAPFILNAESILTKKIQALQWTLEGGRNLTLKWQNILNGFEGGDGWDYFVARWVRAYCESDQPAYVEIIRAAPTWAVDENYQLTERGERAFERGDDKVWPIVDARVMDPLCCTPTTSKEFPLQYRNPHTGVRYNLRPYQFMSLVDQPGVDDRNPHAAVCAVTRAVWAAQEDRMNIRYNMEKISENPGAGLAVINASQTALRTAMKSADSEREARGVVYYKGIVFIPTMDPSGSAKLEFLNFSELPEGWDQMEAYQRNKEIVATAFGLDILEFGSISGRMGTATQAKVASNKSRAKALGSIMQGIERTFRYKLLPESVRFSIRAHDEEVERVKAERDEIYFNNAIRLAQFAPPEVAIQYLADNGAIPNELPYVSEDYNPSEAVEDTTPPQGAPPEGTIRPDREVGPEGTGEEAPIRSRARAEPIVAVDRDGNVKYKRIALGSMPFPFLASKARKIPEVYP